MVVDSLLEQSADRSPQQVALICGGERRTYRQLDNVSRPFGIGTTHSYAVFLSSQNPYQEVDLILPDGGRVHYVRTSPGTGYQDAVFEHTATPTRFYKSKIIWIPGGWQLTMKDGTQLVFYVYAPDGWQLGLANADGTGFRVVKHTEPNRQTCNGRCRRRTWRVPARSSCSSTARARSIPHSS